MLSPSVAAWGSADSAVQDAQLDRGTWASWRPSSEQRCPLSQRHWVTRGDLAFLCISHKNVLRATALWLGPGRLTAQGKWLRRDMCKLPRFTVQSVAETRTRHGREPPVQVSPGQRQIRHRQRLHLLPKCELPELGTPCCQSPRILSLGCRLCVYESVPSSATSPPPAQPRANPGLATYWLCDLRSYNCGHTGHPPPETGANAMSRRAAAGSKVLLSGGGASAGRWHKFKPQAALLRDVTATPDGAWAAENAVRTNSTCAGDAEGERSPPSLPSTCAHE